MVVGRKLSLEGAMAMMLTEFYESLWRLLYVMFLIAVLGGVAYVFLWWIFSKRL